MRPRGNRGEILAISQTDVPGRIEAIKDAQIRLADGTDITVSIENAWQFKGDWVLKLAGVDSITAADRYRNSDLWVPFEERASLPGGEHFRSDLIGCTLVNQADGTVLAKVEAWQQYGGSPLIQATIAGKEVLIPFVPEICPEVDLAERRITVNLPAGLLEL